MKDEELYHKLKSIVKKYLFQVYWILNKSDLLMIENQADNITCEMMAIIKEKIKEI